MSRSASVLYRLAFAALALLVIPPLAGAGTTGKISGRVTNEKKEPLAGVNIRIEGLRLGALSDDQGNYFIIGVPGGTYVVRANLLGEAPFVAENVSVTPDFTTDLNIAMKSEAVQLAEVKVEAERPLLQKDATSTARFLSADQIARLPTRGYQEAAAQQSGVVAFQRLIDRESQNGPTLIIRGGRPNETAFFVDGFSQQDPLTGNSTTSINNNAIQEVVVLNGGFNAEYGRIMSGVVNVLTREGARNYSGSVEALTDNFGGTGNDLLGSKIYDYNIYDANFGGPLLRGHDAGSFYFSGERRWEGDRNPNSAFDGPLPSNSLGGWTGQGKLAIPLAKNISFKLGGLYSQDDWREYLNTYRFDLLHAPRYADRNRSLTGSLNHTLNAKSFYTLGANYFYTERKRGDGLYFDNIDLYSSTPQADFDTAIPWFWPGNSDPNSPLGHVLDSLATASGGTGHVFDDYLRRQSSYVGVKGDYTSQWNAFHQIKSGVEVDRHTLRFYEHYFPVEYPSNVVDIDRYGFSADGRSYDDSGLDGPRKPFTASYYLQDKYERAGLVVNAGARYDYINVDVQSLASENLPLGPDGQLRSNDLVENKKYSRISPRLGIGFPVSDRTVLHVNYGQFFQQPNLQDLYVSYRFLEHKVQTGGYFVGFGNPNLKPEETTAYEVGIANQMSDYAKFDASVYYKDVTNLVEIATIASFPNSFSSYRNKDFATIKGLDLGFTLRRVNHIQANVAYSLSYAVGTGSVSNTQRNIAWVASDPPKQTAPLDFDQRHKVSIDMDYSLGKGEGPKLMSMTWLQNTDLNVLYNIGSGTPYTPTEVYDEPTLAAVSSVPSGPLNSRYGPWTQTVDLKATKSFKMAGLDMSAYLWLLNAFDEKNAVQVYTSTGSPFTTSYLNTAAGQAAKQDLSNKYGLDASQAYAAALQNPSLFTNPRMIRFGLRMGF
jgi:outer membrane receptor protein involved in Fe transport